MANNDAILKKLEKLEKEVKKLRQEMVDPDTIMTEEDYAALIEYRKEKAAGRLVSHEQLKKDLGL